MRAGGCFAASPTSDVRMTRRNGVLFDLDGTLVDSRKDLTAAVNHARAAHALPPLSVQTVTSYIGNGSAALIERSFAGTDVPVKKPLEVFKEYYAAHCAEETTCYPDVHKALDALRRAGMKMAVVTNKPVALTRIVLRRYRLADYFDPVLGGDSLPELKPHPLPLLTVAEAWGDAPASLAMVGDNYTDVAAAASVGMPAVFLTGGFGHLRDEKPDVVCEYVRDCALFLST